MSSAPWWYVEKYMPLLKAAGVAAAATGIAVLLGRRRTS